jgi:hypothetical protein
MELTSHFSHFLISTISFTDFELDIVLDIGYSVEANRGLPGPRDMICFGDGIRLRTNGPTTYCLIPGQDLIALQIFLPDFVQMIQSARNTDLSEIAERGRVSPTLKEYSHAFYYQGRTDLENKIQLLQNCLVVVSNPGRICFYRHKDDYILEVDMFREPAGTFFDIVSPRELISILQETGRVFREAVSRNIRESIS